MQKRKNMIEFASKRRSGRSRCHLTYDWNMNALTTPKDFITIDKTFHKHSTHNTNDPSNKPSRS